jgi:hypothetical protein
LDSLFPRAWYLDLRTEAIITATTMIATISNGFI